MSAPFRLRARNRSPEADLQAAVATELRAYLPDGVWFTCSLSGIRLSPSVAAAAKRAGMEKGAPDLSFIWPDGQTSYIELKAQAGSLTVEQERLQGTLGELFSLCRSVREVRAALAPWLIANGLRWLSDGESVKREMLRRARAA